MINVEEIINKIKLSKETQVSLLISCLLLIWISQSQYLVNAFRIEVLIKTYIQYVFILTIVLIGSILGKPIFDISRSYYRSYIYKRNTTNFLKQLINDEKEILKIYMDENRRSSFFPLSNGTVSGLVCKHILYRSSIIGVSADYDFSFNIQDIAFDILRQHPEYLE
jgi:hypothetical protein